MEISKDKVMHAVVSAFVAAGIAIVIANTGASAFSACLAGFLGAIACGLAKSMVTNRTKRVGRGQTSQQMQLAQ